jgi:hypothetical protein
VRPSKIIAAQPRTPTQEKHVAPFVIAERSHRHIVQNFHGFAEGFRKKSRSTQPVLGGGLR